MKSIRLFISLVIVMSIFIFSFTASAININNSASDTALYIETFINGRNQSTHPDVLAFQKEWNGYKYWMAFTPYPYTDGAQENPSIVVSNDLNNWILPKGGSNPISNCYETNCDELKDPCMLYRSDLDRIELFYLGRENADMSKDSPLFLFRKYSYDGINWSNHEKVLDKNSKVMKYGLYSQSIRYNESKKLYECYSCFQDKITYQTFNNDFIWSNYRECLIPDIENIGCWHGDMYISNDKYIFVYMSKKNSSKIYFTESKDGFNFTNSRTIIDTFGIWGNVYRPSLMYDNNMFYCFYGVVDYQGRWFITYSKGESLDDLIGVSAKELGKTYESLELSEQPIRKEFREKFEDNNINKYFFIDFWWIIFVGIIVIFITKQLISNKVLSMGLSFSFIEILTLVLSVVIYGKSKQNTIVGAITGIVLFLIAFALVTIIFNFVSILRNKKHPK